YQHLEIQLLGLGGLLFELTWIGWEDVVVVQAGRLGVTCAVRIGGQRAVDSRHGARELVVMAGREESLGPGELRRTGVRPTRFQRREPSQQVGDERGIFLFAAPRRRWPAQPFGCLFQTAPGIRPQLPD